MVSGPGQLDGLLLLSQLHVQKKQAGLAKERAEEAKQLADDLQDPVGGFFNGYSREIYAINIYKWDMFLW